MTGTPDRSASEPRDGDVLHPPEVWAHVHRAVAIDESGHPDADRLDIGGQRPGQVEQHLDQPGAAVGGGDPILGQDRARLTRIDEDAEDLRPADVEPDGSQPAGQ